MVPHHWVDLHLKRELFSPLHLCWRVHSDSHLWFQGEEEEVYCSNILISVLYILLEEISPGAFWITPIWTGCSLSLLKAVISRCTFTFTLKISFTSRVPLPGYHLLGVLPHFGTVHVPIASWENVLGRKNWRSYMSEYVFSFPHLFQKI